MQIYTQAEKGGVGVEIKKEGGMVLAGSHEKQTPKLPTFSAATEPWPFLADATESMWLVQNVYEI